MTQELISDLDFLVDQLNKLKNEFDSGISSGKSFIEVKLIHLQIKELTRIVNQSDATFATPRALRDSNSLLQPSPPSLNLQD